VALARTFFRDAPLVILDEPTAALDAKAEHELFGKIGELFAERSVLLISHRFSTVRAADRIYVLREGQVVESGTHESLMGSGQLGWTRAQRSLKEMLSKNAVPSTTRPSASFMIQA
jgi:ATP-binding cassette, subfamily B, bacterial